MDEGIGVNHFNGYSCVLSVLPNFVFGFVGPNSVGGMKNQKEDEGVCHRRADYVPYSLVIMMEYRGYRWDR